MFRITTASIKSITFLSRTKSKHTPTEKKPNQHKICHDIRSVTTQREFLDCITAWCDSIAFSNKTERLGTTLQTGSFKRDMHLKHLSVRSGETQPGHTIPHLRGSGRSGGPSAGPRCHLVATGTAAAGPALSDGPGGGKRLLPKGREAAANAGQRQSVCLLTPQPVCHTPLEAGSGDRQCKSAAQVWRWLIARRCAYCFHFSSE